jgi:L-lactate utilization protein LutC
MEYFTQDKHHASNWLNGYFAQHRHRLLVLALLLLAVVEPKLVPRLSQARRHDSQHWSAPPAIIDLISGMSSTADDLHAST